MSTKVLTASEVLKREENYPLELSTHHLEPIIDRILKIAKGDKYAPEVRE